MLENGLFDNGVFVQGILAVPKAIFKTVGLAADPVTHLTADLLHSSAVQIRSPLTRSH